MKRWRHSGGSALCGWGRCWKPERVDLLLIRSPCKCGMWRRRQTMHSMVRWLFSCVWSSGCGPKDVGLLAKYIIEKWSSHLLSPAKSCCDARLISLFSAYVQTETNVQPSRTQPEGLFRTRADLPIPIAFWWSNSQCRVRHGFELFLLLSLLAKFLAGGQKLSQRSAQKYLLRLIYFVF